MARIAWGPRVAPKSTMTPKKTLHHQGEPEADVGELAEQDVEDPDRRRQHPVEDRTQTMPPMIGKVDSPAAVCIAVEASRPGARNAR